MREKRERQERVISGISETRLDGRGQMTDDSTSKVRDQRSEIGGRRSEVSQLKACFYL